MQTEMQSFATTSFFALCIAAALAQSIVEFPVPMAGSKPAGAQANNNLGARGSEQTQAETHDFHLLGTVDFVRLK
jgi:hypothetical protein